MRSRLSQLLLAKLCVFLLLAGLALTTKAQNMDGQHLKRTLPPDTTITVTDRVTVKGEEVPYEVASRYGVCDTNKYGEITDVVEKPEDPPSNLVMTGFYTFSPAIFHACHLVQPSNRDEYEISDAVDLLIQSGRTIDAIGLDGWRIDVGYPEDRDEAERRLQGDNADEETKTVVESDA